MRNCYRAVIPFFVVFTFFSDGESRYMPVLGHTFFIAKNQCLVDYIGMGNQFYVWMNFPAGLREKAIKKGEKEIEAMCSVCQEYKVICIE